MERIDAKVLRLLRLAGRVGALEGVEPVAYATPWSHEEIAGELRATAAAGVVLARNDGVLPLKPGSVAVLGPTPPPPARSAAAAPPSSRRTPCRRSRASRRPASR